MTTPRNVKLAAFCLACAMPLALLADPPTPKRTGGPSGAGGSERPERTERPGAGRGGPGGDWNAVRERNEHEFDQFKKEFMAFCETHARNRWLEWQKREGEVGAGRLRMNGMLIKFRGLKAMEKQDAKLFNIKVRQIEVEDVEYGSLIALREQKKAAAPDPKEIEKIEAKLRTNAAESVALRLQERSHRINRLIAQLENEKKSLAEDEAAKEKLVAERFNLLVAEGPDFFNSKPQPQKHDPDAPAIPPTTNASQAIP